MVGEDRVIMSVKELRRVHVLRHALEQKITQGQAGEALGLTARHIRRLVQRVRAEGDAGLVHRGRGQPSNRRMPEQVKATVLTLYTRRYADCGPTLAAEQLAERHGITRSDPTLRLWLQARGIIISSGGRDHTGRGASARPTWGHSSSWMARTMTGSRGGDPAVC